MTNPTIPLPVQEPAGAVEATIWQRFLAYAAKAGHFDSEGRTRDPAKSTTAWNAYEYACKECASPQPVTPEGELSDKSRLSLLNKLARNRGFENAAQALASLQPVTQAQALLDAATGKTPHVFNGLCPDSIEGPDVRDPDCPACQALLGVTQAKLEAVAPRTIELWKGSRKITVYLDAEDGDPPLLLKVWGPHIQDDMESVPLSDYGAVRAAFDWLYAAPQEAVERQPLTREQIEAIDNEVMKSPRDYCMKFARAIEAAHGIGPATQEKQHG